MFTVIVNSSGLSLLFTCGTDDRHAVYTRTSINEAWWCQCVCAFVRKNTGWPRAYPTHGSVHMQPATPTGEFKAVRWHSNSGVRQRRKDMQGCINCTCRASWLAQLADIGGGRASQYARRSLKILLSILSYVVTLGTTCHKKRHSWVSQKRH